MRSPSPVTPIRSTNITRIPKAALAYVPPGIHIVQAERLSPAFVKYHLDNGQALHRFTREEPNATPHDHPWNFETEILAGGYVEEVFHPGQDGSWRRELVHRLPGTSHHIDAAHIHRIVGLPAGECWTRVTAGPPQRAVRFWRFGSDTWSRAWNERRYTRYRG